MLKDKCHKEIDKQWRPERNERSVDEGFPNGPRLDTKLAAPPLADPEGAFFKEVRDPVHVVELITNIQINDEA